MLLDTTSLEKEVKLSLLRYAAFTTDKQHFMDTTSDRRIKKNIVDNNEGLSLINQIAVKNFEYKTAEEIESDGEVPSTDALIRRAFKLVSSLKAARGTSRLVTTRETAQWQ